MLPILRSVISRGGRSAVSRRSFSTAAPANSNALKEKFDGAWPYIGPLVGVGVGYGLRGIMVGSMVGELEANRLKELRETGGECVDLTERMWTGVSNRRAAWDWLFSNMKESMMKSSMSFSRKS